MNNDVFGRSEAMSSSLPSAQFARSMRPWWAALSLSGGFGRQRRRGERLVAVVSGTDPDDRRRSQALAPERAIGVEQAAPETPATELSWVARRPSARRRSDLRDVSSAPGLGVTQRRTHSS